MSHYPSSADLAAFRRSFDLTQPPPATTRDGRTRLRAVFVLPLGGGAFAYEKDEGIGRNARPAMATHTEARRGAAALRARAFASYWYRVAELPESVHPGDVQSIGQTPVRPGDARFIAAWLKERDHGCPAWGKE